MAMVDVALPAKWHVAPMYSLLLLACLAQGSPQGDQGFHGTMRPSSQGSFARGSLAPSGVAELRSGGLGRTVSGRVEEGRLRLRGGAPPEGSKEEFVQRARSLLQEAGGAMYSSTFEQSWERAYPDVDMARSATTQLSHSFREAWRKTRSLGAASTGPYKSSESMSVGQLVQKTGAFDVESSPNKGQSTKLFRIPGTVSSWLIIC
ncbi:hypothetical protein T484DRAFT_1853767 [Baffinella frigidus]|nr:hypothetical protein T484DRAFT_1853767 [Cryptophyta sp. CCMP2293]